MAKLVYSAIASLDGYVADGDGDFGWTVPDEEVHAFINDLQQPIGTHLYRRRMYETMVGWETDPTLADQSPVMRDFAAPWQADDKIVYSRTLEAAPTAKTRVERNFDPEAVRQMKASAGQDMLIGGPNIAAQAFGARLVDECRSYWRGPVWPVVNWLLWWSLVRAGKLERAAQIRRVSLDQITQGGFAEYLDLPSGTPLGSTEQSWTAAVALDWLVANKLQSVNMDAA